GAWRAIARPPRYVGATGAVAPPEPMTPAEILADNSDGYRLSNSGSIVAASQASGVPLHIAAALMMNESGGLNVYGHDAGGVFSTRDGSVTVEGTVYSRGSNIVVTASNYAIFEDRVLTPEGDLRPGVISNGVGPAQVTFHGFLHDARVKGFDLSDPEQNMTYALTYILAPLLGGSYTQNSVTMAATRYNAGPTAREPNSYGLLFWKRSEHYRLKLAGAVADPT
ncbi:hypothetical protein VWY15_18995, partial [Phaeobacter sp. Ax3a-5a]|uniref:hypothetical protein n=1 Tax=Phaeobacter sp. Ax3a-5a TaxID=3112436 RepID=UPI003A8615B6